MNPRGLVAILTSFAAAIVLLAATSTYSAYVSSTNHKNSCSSRGLILDTFHDVILDAFAPAPGETVTAKQAAGIEAFEAKAFARIDQARC